LKISGKFGIHHFYNFGLAGGVAISGSANMLVQPGGASIIGFVGGFLATAGYVYVQVVMLKLPI